MTNKDTHVMQHAIKTANEAETSEKQVSLNNIPAGVVEEMTPMQAAIFKDYGVKVTVQEAFEFKKWLVDLIRVLDEIDREVNGGAVC